LALVSLKDREHVVVAEGEGFARDSAPFHGWLGER
jgi:hypothetical protein